MHKHESMSRCKFCVKDAEAQVLQPWVVHGLSEDDEYYAEYDAEYGNRPVVPIKGDPVELNRDREAMRQTWKLNNATRAA